MASAFLSYDLLPPPPSDLPLPADLLFSHGNLLPSSSPSADLLSPRPSQCARLADSNLFSPKAPRCSCHWRELLRLKKLNRTTSKAAAALPSNATSGSRSLKHFLRRSSKSAANASSFSPDPSTLLNLPLLEHSEPFDTSVPTSSRLSVPSSSHAHGHDDLPRLSLSLNSDKNKQSRMQPLRPRSDGNGIGNGSGCSRTHPVASSNRAGRSPIRKAGTGTQSDAAGKRGASVDSPRMNSSGRVVFQSLERSSSSPSSFNGGGQRFKHRGVQRSYSAGVRITPVLNVPICTLRGSSGGSRTGSGVFGLGKLFISSPQKKENGGRGRRINNVKNSRG